MIYSTNDVGKLAVCGKNGKLVSDLIVQWKIKSGLSQGLGMQNKIMNKYKDKIIFKSQSMRCENIFKHKNSGRNHTREKID